MSLLWINGQLIEKADAKVSPFDHGFLYGDGVWEPLRVFKGQLFRPAEHLRLLFIAGESLGLHIPLSQVELTEAIEKTVRANDRTEGYVRVIVSRGPGTLGPDPRKIDAQVIVIAEEYQPFPFALYESGLHAITFPASHHTFRVLGQSHVVQAKCHALKSGCLEAILVDRSGVLFGTTEGSLFIVKDGALVVAADQQPDAIGSIVAALASAMGQVLVEYAVRTDDLLSADEVFVAGTSCGVIGITRVNSKDVGTGAEGPVTRAIRERYHALTRGG